MPLEMSRTPYFHPHRPRTNVSARRRPRRCGLLFDALEPRLLLSAADLSSRHAAVHHLDAAQTPLRSARSAVPAHHAHSAHAHSGRLARGPRGRALPVVLSESAADTTFGAPVTFTATLKRPSTGRRAGPVTFFDGTIVLGQARFQGDGTATLTASALDAGDHQVTATYSLRPRDGASATNAVHLAVAPAQTATSLVFANGAGSAIAGDPAQFTASVVNASSTGAAPTGSVTFLDGNAPIATVPLSAGSAVLNTSVLGLGQHQVRAVFNGNGDFAPSTAVVQAAIVAPPAPALDLPAPQTAVATMTAALSLGSLDQAGSAGPWTVTIHWGDGTPDTTVTRTTKGSLGTQKHTYASAGTYTVQEQVTDQFGSTTLASAAVKVAASTITLKSPGDQTATVATASSILLGTLNRQSSDHGPWQIDVNWGDGTPDTIFQEKSPGSLGSQTHTYAGHGSYTVTETATGQSGPPASISFTVSVPDVAPTVTAPSDQAASAGLSTALDLGSFTQPGNNNSPWSVDINWGDGTAHTTFSVGATGALGSQAHTYAGAGSYTVTETVTDNAGASASATFTVSVTGVGPVVTGPSDQTAVVAVSSALDLGSFTQAGNNNPWTVDVDWGDGSAHTTFSVSSAGALGNQAHTYGGHGSYTATETVTDSTGKSASAAFTVAVPDVAPTLTAPANQTAVVASSSSIALGSFTQPGNNNSPWSVDINWGDGTAHTTFSAAATGALGAQAHTYGGHGSYTVTETVTDSAGTSGSATFTVSVPDIAPTVTAPANQTVAVGTSSAIGLGSFTQPGNNNSPWTVDINWGDGTAHTAFNVSGAGSLGTQAHSYAGKGTYTVSETVTDASGQSGTASFTVSVAAAAPTVTPPGNQTALVGKSSSVTLGSFSQPGTNNSPWSVDVNWGDGTAHTQYSVTSAGALGTQVHTYAAGGAYPVTVTVTDNAGQSGAASFGVSAVSAAPVVAGPADQSALATMATTLGLGSFAESGNVGGPWTVDVSWGDGTAHTTFGVNATGGLAAQAHSYATAGTYTVTETVTDASGNPGTASFQVTAVALPASTGAPQILLTPSVLASLRQEAAANTPQWQAFKARLDGQLNQVIPALYQANELTWIMDYALGYQVLATSDPTTASAYADKALALMKSALTDDQRGYSSARQFLALGDGATRTFVLPNADVNSSTLTVWNPPVQVAGVTKGSANGVDYSWLSSQPIISLSDTPGGPATYQQGRDWVRGVSAADAYIDWSPAGAEPATGAAYYESYADSTTVAPSANYTYDPQTHAITFTTAPAANTALFVQYVYGTPSGGASTLGYQQTGDGNGGFANVLIDTTYTSRYLGKYVALGLDWLWNYQGFNSQLKAQAQGMLVRWFNYLQQNGYYYNSPASNYGAGSYVSDMFTALALNGRDPSGASELNAMVGYHNRNVLPLLTNPTTSLVGGFWSEGWNYGELATENVLLGGMALQTAGLSSGTAEAAWAGQVIEALIQEQPTQQTVYDAGDWYTWPTPLPGKGLFYVLTAAASDPTARSYGNYIIQNYPGGQWSDSLDLLFRDPSASASSWTSSLPLQSLATGTGLLTARADWSYQSTWLAFQSGNLLGADHQAYAPGMLELQRGGDALLVNATSLGGWQGLQKSRYSNTVVVNDPNNDGLQTYANSMGVWYGNPGVTMTAYEANAGYVYASTNFAAAYSTNTNPGGGGPVTQLTRQLVYLRPDVVVVHDRVGTVHDNDMKADEWNFLNAPAVSGNTFTESVGQSKLFGTVYSSLPLTLSVQPVTVGDATVQQMLVQNASPTQHVSYTTVFQTSSSSGALMASAQIQSADGKMEGVQSGSNVVLFGTGANPVDTSSGSVSYTVSGTGAITHLLTDMQAGKTYQVTANGVAVGSFTASSQGTISFTTSATGTQTIVVS